jgi:hypothetical protein
MKAISHSARISYDLASVMETSSSMPSVSTRTCRFLPFTFFFRVKTSRATLAAGFNGLGIEDSDRRLFLSTGSHSDLLAKAGIDPVQSAIIAPQGEIFVDCSPRREVVRQKPPRTTSLGDVKQSVANLPQVVLTRPPFPLGRRKERLDDDPLLIREIRGVRFPFHAWTLQNI